MEPENKPADDKTGTTTTDDQGKKPDDKSSETNPLQSELETTKAELEKLRKEQKDREDADLSEKEREKKRADEAEQLANKREENLRRVSILQAARDAAPALNVELDVEALRDLYSSGAFKNIKLDDNGDPIGVNDLMKQLVKSKPYIVKPATTAKAPDINADKQGDEKPGEMSDDRKANLKKRFRLK